MVPPYGGGNRIVVDHGNGLKSTYNHLAAIETSVGATVTAGQRLAAAGTTGNSTGCHLHFEVLLNGQTVNPQMDVSLAHRLGCQGQSPDVPRKTWLKAKKMVAVTAT